MLLDAVTRDRAALLHAQVRLALAHLAQWRPWMAGDDAEHTLMAYAAHESVGYRFTRQQTADGYGPARSVWQIEPATFEDVVDRIVWRSEHLREALAALIPPDLWASPPAVRIDALRWNTLLAAAVARIRLLDEPAPLPKLREPAEVHAAYWLKAYNRTRDPVEQPRRLNSFTLSYRAYIEPMKREMWPEARG